MKYLLNFNRGINARIVFLPLHEVFFSLHNSDIEIELFHRGTIKQTLCTTKTLGAVLQGAWSDVSKGFRNKIHNPRCWYACRCKTVPFFPFFDSSSNFLRRIIKKRKSLRYLREDFFFFFLFYFSRKKQRSLIFFFISRFLPRKLWII